MSFDISDLPDPENRTAQQWVVFYLRLESAVAQNREVSVNGRSFAAQDLDTIIKMRKDWEGRIGRDTDPVKQYAPVYLG